MFDAKLPLTVHCLRESYTGDSIIKASKRYYGSTQDGSLYRFTVLSRNEWEFLDFVARLTWKRPVTHSNIKRKNRGLQRKEPKRIRPTDMHINGDHVSQFLRGGPEELRRLIHEPSPELLGYEALSPERKLAELIALGEPLFGSEGDPVLAASQWLQKLVGNM